MKKILRIVVIELTGLYVATQIASGLVFKNSLEGILITSIALGLATYFLRPLINILLLPLTIITMGLFKVVSHTITIFIVDVALVNFEVSGFNFAGFSSPYFDLPSVSLGKGPFAYLAFSILIWSVTSFINWLRK